MHLDDVGNPFNEELSLKKTMRIFQREVAWEALSDAGN